MSSERCTVTVTGHDDEVTVAVSGEVDQATVTEIDAAVDRVAGPGTVALDLSGVTFMDSAGLRTAVQAMRAQQGAGGTLVVRHPSPMVDRLLRIAGLDGPIPVER